MNAVYEVVDYTDGERYYPLGIFDTLDEAVDALNIPRPPDSPWDHDDFYIAAVYERPFGWSENGKRVYEVRWEQEYDEQIDEYYWVRKEAKHVD